jgi:ribonuclease-3
VKFPQQLEITLRKLEEYVIEFNGNTAPARVELKHSLFKTYEKAARRQEKLLFNERIAAGIDEVSLKENKENKGREEEEEKGEADSNLDVTFAAALEEIKANIKNRVEKYKKNTRVVSQPVERDQKERRDVEEENIPDNETFSSSFIFILKAFYRSVVVSPVRSLLSSIRLIIAWVVHLPLVLYRLLPYGCRKLFHTSWPPKLPTTRHISPAIDALFLDESRGFNRASLLEAGFDAQGRCAAPLAPLLDVPAWKLEQLVGCGIGDAHLYRSALTHPTALPPEYRALSYERLEYLGDAVLELCTRQLLMERAPDADEGVLTNQGQFLVSGSTVNKYGAWMGLDKWVLCNVYSMRDGLRGSPHILGDSFEALLAAVYVDRGLEAARKLLIRVFNQCPSVEWDKIGFMRDHKGELIKVAHQRRKPLPMYYVVDARYAMYRDEFSGTGNGMAIKKKYWTVEVEFDGEVIGSASNFEKREAEQLAARQGLVFLGELEESGGQIVT